MADVATLGVQVKSTGVTDTTKALGELSGAAARAEAGTESLSGANRGAVGAASSAAKAFATEGSAAASASKQIELLNRAANQNKTSLAAVGSSAQGSSYQLKAVAMQLSQVAQQTQAGTGFLQALAIQLPDLALAFGPVGIAAGVAAGLVLTYFGNVLSSSSDSKAALAEQAKLISAVSQSWGEGIPAIQQYADQLDRIKLATDAAAVAEATRNNIVAETAAKIGDLNFVMADLQGKLMAAGEKDEVINRLNTAFQTLKGNVEEGKATQDDFNRVIEAAEAASATGIGGIDAFIKVLETLRSSAVSAAEAVAETNKAIGAAQNKALNDPRTWRGVGIIGNPEGAMGGTSTDPDLPMTGPSPGSRPSDLETAKNRGYVKTGGGAKSDGYATAIRASQDRTKAIVAETAAQASLNPFINDYGYAITKAKASADLLAAAEKQKLAITPQLNSQIEKTASALADATAAQNRQTEATQKAKEQMEFVKNTTAGFINDLRSGLKDGEGFWKTFGNAALNVLDRITDKLLNEVLDAVFKVGNASGTSGGGGLFSSILGGLFGGGQMGIAKAGGVGLYAAGTPAARPGVAWVGEKGPELVRFKGGEEVIPNHKLMSANQNSSAAPVVSAPQAVSVSVGVTVDKDGNLQAYVKNVAQQEGTSAAAQVVRQNNEAQRNYNQNGGSVYG